MSDNVTHSFEVVSSSKTIQVAIKFSTAPIWWNSELQPRSLDLSFGSGNEASTSFPEPKERSRSKAVAPSAPAVVFFPLIHNGFCLFAVVVFPVIHNGLCICLVNMSVP